MRKFHVSRIGDANMNTKMKLNMYSNINLNMDFNMTTNVGLNKYDCGCSPKHD